MNAGEALARMAALPETSARELLRDGRPLILAPHPDDEVLGCGGLIAALCAAGMPPAVAFVTDGAGSHPRSRQWPGPRLAALREAEARQAAAVLGLPAAHLHFLRFPDTRAPAAGSALAEAAEHVAGLAARTGATALLASWGSDPHCDHAATHAIAARAAARSGLRHLSYPVWGWTLPAGQPLGAIGIAGFRLPVGRHMRVKLRALRAHASQLGGVVTDDPTGFRLTARVLRRMLRPYETFLENP